MTATRTTSVTSHAPLSSTGAGAYGSEPLRYEDRDRQVDESRYRDRQQDGLDDVHPRLKTQITHSAMPISSAMPTTVATSTPAMASVCARQIGPPR